MKDSDRYQGEETVCNDTVNGGTIMNVNQIIRLLFGFIVIYGLMGCTSHEEEGELIRPVRYEVVGQAAQASERTFSGVSQAGKEVKLSFRVSGMVTKVFINVGDKVKQGNLIAAVDDTDANLTLQQAEVSVEKSRVQMETARSNLSRIRGLYENNNVSLSDYEAAKSTSAAAKAAFNADKRSLELQKRILGYYRLYAPMNGIVTAVDIEPNENVAAGQVVAELNAGDEIEVNVGIPEAIISNVRSGDEVEVRFTSHPDTKFPGIVSEVAFAANVQTSTYPVTVKLLGDMSKLRPGMSADVTFQFKEKNQDKMSPALLVPTHAVSEDNIGSYVFVLEESTTETTVVHRKRVNVGKLTRNGFEILDGLSEGDLVVTAGMSKMRDGMTVKWVK